MDISHNKLTFLPSNLLKLSELMVLNVSFNLLRTLPGDPEDVSATSSEGMVWGRVDRPVYMCFGIYCGFVQYHVLDKLEIYVHCSKALLSSMLPVINSHIMIMRA